MKRLTNNFTRSKRNGETVVKKAILLAVAVIAVAALNVYTDSAKDGKTESSGVLDTITAKLVLMMKKSSGGAAALKKQADVKDSPYFKSPDIYNMTDTQREAGVYLERIGDVEAVGHAGRDSDLVYVCL